MDKILFLLDSPGDVSREQIDSKPIIVVPVTIAYNNEIRRDFYDIDSTQYWKELQTCEDMPKTAQIPPHIWLERFEAALCEGYTHVIVTTLSATASGTYNSVCVASDLFYRAHGERLIIRVLDSRNYSFLYGEICINGAEMAMRGASFEEVNNAMEDMIARRQGLLWAYSLKYLKKSGRITGMAAFVGETLGLRPILWIRDGVISPIERVRGEKNLVARVAELAKNYCANPQEQDMTLLYSDVPEGELEKACESITGALSPRSLSLQPIGPVISLNCGPNAMALCFYGSRAASKMKVNE